MSHKEKKKRKKKYRGFWLFVKLQIVLILLVIGGLAYYYFGGYASQVSAMHEEAVRFVKESTKDTFRAEQTSQVYDVNGTRIMSLRGTKDVSYLTSDEIPEEVKEAMVSIEDKKFYRNFYWKYYEPTIENSRKQGELLGTPEVDNQQPSLDSNIFEGSTTNDQIQTSKVEDGNIDTSALPNILNISDDIV